MRVDLVGRKPREGVFGRTCLYHKTAPSGRVFTDETKYLAALDAGWVPSPQMINQKLPEPAIEKKPEPAAEVKADLSDLLGPEPAQPQRGKRTYRRH